MSTYLRLNLRDKHSLQFMARKLAPPWKNSTYLLLFASLVWVLNGILTLSFATYGVTLSVTEKDEKDSDIRSIRFQYQIFKLKTKVSCSSFYKNDRPGDDGTLRSV